MKKMAHGLLALCSLLLIITACCVSDAYCVDSKAFPVQVTFEYGDEEELDNTADVGVTNLSAASDDKADKNALIDEAKKAYQYLNLVRVKPSAYSKEIGYNLNTVKPRKTLVWNEILATAALRKAKDMAIRGYFAHVDPEGYGMNYFINQAGYKLPDAWVKDKGANYFESLSAGMGTGVEVIRQLIYDGGAANGCHRLHLLGINDFWANCEDIGIGIYYNPDSTYQYYACVLIAKHDF